MAVPPPKERIFIRFDSPERLREEFEKNISNGGIFVPSEGDYSIRQPVVVEIELEYPNAARDSFSLDGEVVHLIGPEMVASGATPGVAIQFAVTAEELRERFEPLLGEEIQVPMPDEGIDGSHKRRARRRAVRVPIRVMPASSPPFEATSRDLSSTGILISMGEVLLPKGEFVRICLWHPSGEKSVEIDGMVVREVKNEAGEIAAVAVAFDRSQCADPRVVEVTEALTRAGYQSQLGGISGSIADLGLANLLQMFGSSAPKGTVVCEHDGQQGWVAFADGDLLAAELGSLRGQDAMIEMLDWPEGRFDFEANADEKLIETAERRPLAGAILAAVCAIDERDAESETAEDDDSIAEIQAPEWELGPATVFGVDAELEASLRATLGKVDEAVLDLAKSGLGMQKILEIVPEEVSVIQGALEGLVESGVLLPR